jgi:hypothetical protein
MGEAEHRVPVGVDPTRASIARVYDAMLGGKDNYEIDRAVKRELLKVAPELATIARDNREWLIRVTRFLVGTARVDQILDCGSGLPAAENTHEAAARLNPDTKVVYVDNDPVVAAHGRALLEEGRNAFFAVADLTRPDEVLADDTVVNHIDLTRPLGLMQVSTLHHVADDLDPAAIMRAYVDRLPSGSYVAITHFYDPGDVGPLATLAAKLQDIMVSGPMGSGYFRTRDEIAAMFAGLDLIDPGLTLLPDWWPDGPRTRPLLDVQQLILGGVARKP